ncbi:hypothetical protein Pla8534_06100 [Lignipirellula cremea]|uniref:Uncharacterized protein n=1 Tax=Lignipirellula cremea TaxID=2528010 RepID=A0A518DLW9_9BACT|nr:hypothetical protein Pla8534_06100 [Lignipirellula cremea]
MANRRNIRGWFARPPANVSLGSVRSNGKKLGLDVEKVFTRD